MWDKYCLGCYHYEAKGAYPFLCASCIYQVQPSCNGNQTFLLMNLIGAFPRSPIRLLCRIRFLCVYIHILKLRP